MNFFFFFSKGTDSQPGNGANELKNEEDKITNGKQLFQVKKSITYP